MLNYNELFFICNEQINLKLDIFISFLLFIRPLFFVLQSMFFNLDSWLLVL